MYVEIMAKKKAAKKAGRPPKDGVSRDTYFQMRLSRAELSRLKKIARKRDISVAELLMEPYRKGHKNG